MKGFMGLILDIQEILNHKSSKTAHSLGTLSEIIIPQIGKMK
jgi:hypothetical protein